MITPVPSYRGNQWYEVETALLIKNVFGKGDETKRGEEGWGF